MMAFQFAVATGERLGEFIISFNVRMTVYII
jgi:hypothetical protein